MSSYRAAPWERIGVDIPPILPPFVDGPRTMKSQLPKPDTGGQKSRLVTVFAGLFPQFPEYRDQKYVRSP